MRHHLPPPSVDPRGLHVDHCATPLPRDSVLAGIKHLNRLHQVLARAEADARGLDEGLCGFDDGQLVCATAANLFAVVDGELRTPPVTEAGVAGVCRAALLADPWFGRDIRCTAVSREDLGRASEIFLTNAVRGVLAVRRCGSREVSPGAATGAARAAMARVGLPPMAG
jgi:4-amino-4-deoxychorismate lyase